MCLLDGKKVVVDRGLTILRCVRGEEPAATEADDIEACIPQHVAGLFYLMAGEMLAPDGDAAHACCWVVACAVIQRPRFRGHRMDAKAVHGLWFSAPTCDVATIIYLL